MEFVNTFENGMHKDSNLLLQPSGTYRDMNNGMLVSYDGNDYVVEMPKGTQVSFTLPNNYLWNGNNDGVPTPIGFISFLDVLVVFSTGGVTGYGEIGIVEFDEDGIGTYTPLYYHTELNFSTSNQIRGFTYEENDRIKRVYWTDNNTQPKVLNINDTAFTPIASGDLINGEQYMVVGGIIAYDDGSGLKEYGPGLDDATNNLLPNIFTAGAVNTFATSSGSPIVYKYLDKVLLDWSPDRENPNIDFKQPITGSLNGGSKSYFVRYKLKEQGVVTSWSYGSFPINVYSIGAYSSYTFVEGSGASAVQATTTGVRLTISEINTYYDTIELAVATFDQVSNTLSDAYIVTTQPITSDTIDLDHTTEGGEAVTIDDLTLFPATIFKVKDITTNKNYNVVANIEERSELEDFDGTAATVSDLTYYMPADRIFPNVMNMGLDKQPSTGVATNGIIPDGKYVVTGNSGDYVTYMGNNYGPTEVLGPYFTGMAGVSNYIVGSGSPVVKACILIKKYKSQTGFNRYKCIELNDDYFDYRGMAATQYLRQYWGEETYRIGLMPYDKKGNPMYVRWIDDYEIQSYNDKGGPMVQRNQYASLKINGLTISGITFSAADVAKMSGFSIVRAPRDKQAMAQGLIFPTYYNPADAIRQYPLGLLDDCDTTNSYSNVLNWYSPDEMFEYSGFTGGANNYLEGRYFLGNMGLTYEDGVYQKFTKYYASSGDNLQQYKIDRYDVVNPGSSISNYYLGLTFDNNLTKTSAGNAAGFGVTEGVGCRNVIMTIGGNMKTSGGVDIGATSTIEKPLFNYKILKSNLYGGTSERSLANTIYISTGHYQRFDSSVLADNYDSGTNTYIFDEVEVFGGDSFLTIMSLGKSLYDDHYSQSFSYGIFFPVESNCNPYLRQGRNIGQYGMSNNTTNGVFYDIGGTSRVEQFLLNDAYATDNSIIAYPALPDAAFSDKFPYRVRWAGPKTLGETTDSFRTFLQNNFRDLDGNKGEINNVRERDGKVFYWQDRAVGYLPILERQMVNGALGEATQLGVGGVIDRFDSLNTYFGNQNTNGLVETEYGYAWFDFRRRAMLVMTVGGGIQEVSFVKGLRTFFNESTRFDTGANDPITIDRPLIGEGICGVYDPMYKMTYLHFKWKESASSYGKFTIGYFHPRNIFVGFFDLDTSIAWNHNNFLIGNKSITAGTIQVSTDYFVGDVVVKDNIEYTAITDFTTANPVSGEMEPGYVYPNSDPSVYWAKTTQSNETDLLFSTNNYCKFFGYTYNHDIEVIINPKTGQPFSVDNLLQKSNETNYDNVTFTTDDDTATESTTNNKFYRYYDRGWHSSVAMGTKGRLVDYYLKVKLSITNYSGNPTNSRNLQKVFNFVKSLFRIKK